MSLSAQVASFNSQEIPKAVFAGAKAAQLACTCAPCVRRAELCSWLNLLDGSGDPEKLMDGGSEAVWLFRVGSVSRGMEDRSISICWFLSTFQLNLCNSELFL